ncbi:CRISPR-associated endonuclease Cas2 [Sphaerotilus uruguayifluvii]|uniref:CRISPR-associated endoribonuclease Cas2 n=1 Tax=Sphaerotilus uruguayifluvii TaxID=2735897 RepID=A0ABX2G6T5_9BURK|nr:CRISPR-associated endonuclease Cas2 [Leptothrix sp. C29]NRT58046.1 CRISPR-associated protein Cas2 [Leptothrix sp. C29]
MSTPTRHLYLAAYDIREDRRRVAALKMLRGYATGGQKSVHEVWLTEAEKRRMLDEIVWLIDDSTDRFFLLRLDPRQRTLTLGVGEAPSDPDFFYVG